MTTPKIPQQYTLRKLRELKKEYYYRYNRDALNWKELERIVDRDFSGVTAFLDWLERLEKREEGK